VDKPWLSRPSIWPADLTRASSMGARLKQIECVANTMRLSRRLKR